MDTRGTQAEKATTITPGWKDDPKRPGVQRYWLDGGWDDLVPPRPKPPSTWEQARTIALGVLMALALAYILTGGLG